MHGHASSWRTCSNEEHSMVIYSIEALRKSSNIFCSMSSELHTTQRSSQALSNNVPICQKRGLHSLRLLPHYDGLKAHLDTLEAMPPPVFSKPPHLSSLHEGQVALEEACEIKFGLAKNKYKDKDKRVKQNGLDLFRDQAAATLIPPEWTFKDSSDPTALGHPNSTPEEEAEWKLQVRLGYERVVQTLWRVAKEFDVRGYGTLLREKLTTKWCDCGCSTDHLGEVCERTVREDEEDRRRIRERVGGRGKEPERDKENGHSDCRVRVGKGKQREWDGRGSGIYGWETEEEEDVWEVELDFAGVDPEELEEGVEPDMTIGEVMELRYLKAERAKEEVCLTGFGSLPTNISCSRETKPFARVNLRMQSSIMKPHTELNLSCLITSLTSPLPI